MLDDDMCPWLLAIGATLAIVGSIAWCGKPFLYADGFIPTVSGMAMVGASIEGTIRYFKRRR